MTLSLTVVYSRWYILKIGDYMIQTISIVDKNFLREIEEYMDCNTERGKKMRKAICDKLYSLTPVGNVKELEMMLFEDLRIDEVIFDELDKSKLTELCDLYSSKTLHILKKYLEDNNDK